MSAASTWSNTSRSTNTYTLTDKLASALYESWNGTAWQNGQKFSYGYDNNGYAITYLYQMWNNPNWQDASRTNMTNDANGNLLQSTSQSWVMAASTWSNSSRATNTYTLTNKIASTIYENWSGGGAWQNGQRYLYTYDNNGYLISYLYQNWANSAWKDVTSITNTNDSYGNPTLSLYQNWVSGASPTWTNTLRITNTYSTVTTTSPTGIRAYANAPVLKIYPVPATDAVQVEFNGQPCAYSIYDEAGNKMSTAMMASGANSIDITTLAKGVYFLRTEQGENIKIIKH